MNDTFLDIVVATTRERIARTKSDHYLSAFRKKAEDTRRGREPHLFRATLSDPSSINIIAEFKRASPSKGVFNASADPVRQARRYMYGGAAAISVLTEPEYFHGSLDDLVKIRQAVDTPVLRKDFIVDEYQIVEAAAAGADAVLLIVAALPTAELSNLRRLAEDDLELDALVEVHDEDEVQRAIDAGANLLGVNNRDLKTLEVSLEVSRKLIANKPTDAVMISESGLSSRDEIDELRGLGFDGFLIGESLMKASDPKDELQDLMGVLRTDY